MKQLFAWIFCLAVFVFFPIYANAATWTVTKTNDTNDGVCDADCSLREAVAAADGDGAPSAINFAPALYYQIVTVNAGDIPIFGDSLIINGPGADRLTLSGGGVNRLFDLATVSTFTLNGVKVTAANGNGFSSSGFGGVFTSFGSATITIDRVYFLNNSSSSQSGVAYFAGGTLNISNSTFAGNTSGNCGALSLAGGFTTIYNSTFSGNGAPPGVGGALCMSSGANVVTRNSTITNNNSAMGGGTIVLSGSGIFNPGNTVLAGNTATTSPEIHYSGGTVSSSGNNHIGDSAGDSTATNFPITWDGTDSVNTNPNLGALVNNGGVMPTRLPNAGSPLINTGSNALASAVGLTLDQRGGNRFVGVVDKGATEFGALAPTAANVSISGRVTNSAGRAISGVLIVISDQQGNVSTARSNPFGYYRFDNVAAGLTYTLTPTAKRYSFFTRVLSAADNITDVDFITQ